MSEPQTLETARFGPVEYSPDDLLEFPEGMPGFEKLRRFLLIENPELDPFKFLQSAENPAISFALLPPQTIRPDYRVELPKEKRNLLSLEDPEQAAVLTIVTLEGPTQATANLFAPVIINLIEKKAAQVILVGSDYDVRTPIA